MEKIAYLFLITKRNDGNLHIELKNFYSLIHVFYMRMRLRPVVCIRNETKLMTNVKCQWVEKIIQSYPTTTQVHKHSCNQKLSRIAER
jgi:hypothetical protein